MTHGKLAAFTDIHWGKKGNSIVHNTDCMDFVKWFASEVKKDRSITAIAFLGDWFENRNAVNIQTFDMAFDAMEILDSLGLPFYFCVGNHDLYHRENRKIFSTRAYSKFKNVRIINEITEIKGEDLLFAPYLFQNEYSNLASVNSKYWLGHFEFRNFVVTGTDRKMEHGQDHKSFTKPTYIISGHFHKRQAMDNTVFMGSPFPMDYGDAWDDKRGMMILNRDTEDIEFKDWPDAPTYRKIKLSSLLEDIDNLTFPAKCRVKCIIDIEIAYTEAQDLKASMIESFGLREFAIEESAYDRKEAIVGDEETIDGESRGSLDEEVIDLIVSNASTLKQYNPDLLIEIFKSVEVSLEK